MFLSLPIQLQASKLGFGGNKSITAFYSGHQVSRADSPAVRGLLQSSAVDRHQMYLLFAVLPPLLTHTGVAAQLPSPGGHLGSQQ